MKRALFCVLAAMVALSELRAEMREWTDRAGRKFAAEIIANDARRVRATAAAIAMSLPAHKKIVAPGWYCAAAAPAP